MRALQASSKVVERLQCCRGSESEGLDVPSCYRVEVGGLARIRVDVALAGAFALVLSQQQTQHFECALQRRVRNGQQ